MSADKLAETACNIARSLSVVGDRWSLMILHELGIDTCRFEILQARTLMSPHLLAGRLRKLEQGGILERKLYCNRPARYEYVATEKGRDLHGVLVSLAKWHLHWHASRRNGGRSVACSSTRPTVFEGPSWNASKGEFFSFDNCILVQGPKWKAERAANLASFHAARTTTKRAGRTTRLPIEVE